MSSIQYFDTVGFIQCKALCQERALALCLSFLFCVRTNWSISLVSELLGNAAALDMVVNGTGHVIHIIKVVPFIAIMWKINNGYFALMP